MDEYLCEQVYSAFTIDDCNVSSALYYVPEEEIPEVIMKNFTLNEVMLAMEVKRRKHYLAISMMFDNGEYGFQVFEVKRNSSIPTPGGTDLEKLMKRNSEVLTFKFVTEEVEEEIEE